jgi:hypothetical protein
MTTTTSHAPCPPEPMTHSRPDAVMSDSHSQNGPQAHADNHFRGPVPPPFHVTLTIGQEDASIMMKASKDFNEVLNRLRQQGSSKDTRTGSESEPMDTNNDSFNNKEKSVSPSKAHGAKVGEEQTGSRHCQNASIIDVLIDAAKQCSNTLVHSFIDVLEKRNKSEKEKQACLVLFLDMDKSTKLLTAFQVLEGVASESDSSDKIKEISRGPQEIESSPPDSRRDAKVKEELRDAAAQGARNKTGTNKVGENEASSAEPSLETHVSPLGMKMLFQSFLTAISMCIHDQQQTAATPKPSGVPGVTPTSESLTLKDKNSPERNDGSMVERLCFLEPSKEVEIRDISSYAADQLIKHVEKKREKSRSEESKRETLVTFEDFGEWYNDGGFGLVPWLELLSLSKWDFAGKASHGTPSKSMTRDESSPSDRLPPSVSKSPEPRKCVVSFDFTGAMPHDKPLHIDITESNLVMLKAVVTRTGLFRRTPQEMCEVILRHASHSSGSRASQRPGMPPPTLMLTKNDFGRCMRELIPPTANLVHEEIVNFSNFLVSLFSCYDRQERLTVNAKEIAAGFSFLCGGNKSNKVRSYIT